MQVISDPYRVSCFLKGLLIKKRHYCVASLFTDLPLDSLIDLHIADSSYPSIKYTIRNISSSVNKKQGEPPGRYHEVLETADDTYGEFHVWVFLQTVPGFPDRVPGLVVVIHSLDLSRTIYDNGMCTKYLYTGIVLTNVFWIGRVLSGAYAPYGPEAERFTLLNRIPFGKFNKVNPEPVNAYEICTDKR